MKRMLFNATQPEELRVALVDGQKLYDLDIETSARAQKKSNIYRGIITRVEPSLEAAFVNYGANRHGFLPLKDVARSLFRDDAPKSGRVNIKDVLREGQELTVQIEKEERGNKGAALTTFISLPGRYSVLMPNNPRAGGVSRRIEGADRSELKESMSALEIPEGMGLIIRTAGVGRQVGELQWDLDYLMGLWKSIDAASTSRQAPFLIYQESNVIIRAIRDYLSSDIGEILIDNPDVLADAQAFIQQVMPHNLHKAKFYDDKVPLFSRYQIESQIESAYQREVRLPSGGALVIDHTEALISIDINSARATKGHDIEETALTTNLEACDEIARQLRLRDLGGLVVIDYIDMGPSKNQRKVENQLREALKADRARVQVGRISRFGLMEMSRQRLRPSLGESSHTPCPRCDGQGTIRGVESLSLSILRIFEEEALKDKTRRVIAQVPLAVATYLMNEKRDMVQDIEDRLDIHCTVVPNPNLQTPQYEISRVRSDDPTEIARLSYHVQLAEEPEEDAPSPTNRPPAAQPVVRMTTPNAPAPAPAPKAAPKPAAAKAAPATPSKPQPKGLIKRVLNALLPSAKDSPAEPDPTPGDNANSGQRQQQRSGSQQSGRASERGGRNRGRNRGRGRSGQSNQNQGSQKQSSQNQGGNRNVGQSQQNRSAEGNQNQRRNQQQRSNQQPNARRNDGNRVDPQQQEAPPANRPDNRNENRADSGNTERSQGSSSRRGRRGGRRRRGGGSGGERGNVDGNRSEQQTRPTETNGNVAEPAAQQTPPPVATPPQTAAPQAPQPESQPVSNNNSASQSAAADKPAAASQADTATPPPESTTNREARRDGRAHAKPATAEQPSKAKQEAKPATRQEPQPKAKQETRSEHAKPPAVELQTKPTRTPDASPAAPGKAAAKPDNGKTAADAKPKAPAAKPKPEPAATDAPTKEKPAAKKTRKAPARKKPATKKPATRRPAKKATTAKDSSDSKADAASEPKKAKATAKSKPESASTADQD